MMKRIGSWNKIPRISDVKGLLTQVNNHYMYDNFTESNLMLKLKGRRKNLSGLLRSEVNNLHSVNKKNRDNDS